MIKKIQSNKILDFLVIELLEMESILVEGSKFVE